ncbi:MAG: glycosyltransferase family 4 protein [Terriglobales bacterium]
MPETNSNNPSALGGRILATGGAGFIGSAVGEPAELIAGGPPARADRQRPVRSASAGAGHGRAPGGGFSVALLTGGFDRAYTYGLAMALARAGVPLEIIGSDVLDRPEYHCTPGVKYRNLRGGQDASRLLRALRLGVYYLRLIRYSATARPKIFHVLWNNRVEWLDRTILMLYYRLLGKRVVLTAHNVNQAARDGRDSAWNRLTLRIQYRLADAIFVHTEAMGEQLRTEFGVRAEAIVRIPYGVDDSIPVTSMTPAQARGRLGLSTDDRVLLFFGHIRSNKGLEYLARAFISLARRNARYKLIIAGQPRRDAGAYWASIQCELGAAGLGNRVVERAEHVPDEETEVYFKAADVFVLPYRDVFQSGVLFLGLGFGLPAIATAVGGLADAVVDGENGLLCERDNAESLAAALDRYFSGELYTRLDVRREEIARRVRETNSWAKVAEITAAAYRGVPSRGRGAVAAEHGGQGSL